MPFFTFRLWQVFDRVEEIFIKIDKDTYDQIKVEEDPWFNHVDISIEALTRRDRKMMKSEKPSALAMEMIDLTEKWNYLPVVVKDKIMKSAEDINEHRNRDLKRFRDKYYRVVCVRNIKERLMEIFDVGGTDSYVRRQATLLIPMIKYDDFRSLENLLHLIEDSITVGQYDGIRNVLIEIQENFNHDLETDPMVVLANLKVHCPFFAGRTY